MSFVFHIGPTSPGQNCLSRRAVGICAEAIGPIVFSHTYDSNGNQTSDPDAGLTGMTYNALNLLSGYTDSSTGKQTSLSYTASGEKFGVSTLNGQIISKHWNRFGSVVYDNSFSPTHLLVDGGYVDLTGALGNATYAYRFYVQDHQGNNRMVMDANGTVLQVNHYDPYGQLLTPISSTTAVSQYKYGGKEWSGTTLSYDFGARNYLPALPRWSSMDPLAEKYYSVSPYVYCAGNPVNLVDEGGRSIYGYDYNTGTMLLLEDNSDDFDEIRKFKYNHKTGEYIPMGLIFGGIEKGILRDKMNFHEDNYIEIIGETGPSIEGIQDFLLGFSNMIDKEVGGYYVSIVGQDNIKYVTIGDISRNTANNAKPGNPYKALKNVPGFSMACFEIKTNYHTHLSRFSEADRTRPSSIGGRGGDIGFKERQSRNNPGMKFLIITNPTPFYY